jgi:photosystem II stability/assembly factor-like uncharacterized protein
MWGYPEIYDLAFSETNPDILYAATVGSPGPLTGNYPSTDSGVYKSTDGGETWVRKNCGINNGRVTTVHVDPDNPDVAFVAPAGGSISFTIDPMDSDLEPNQFFDGGIFRTTDGGETWTRIDIADNDNRCQFSSIRAVSSNPSTLYTFCFEYDDNDMNLNLGFLKSMDRGLTWSQIAPDMREKLIGHFDVSSDGNTIYAAYDMMVATSTDGGETWTEYEMQGSTYTLAVSPSDPNRVVFSDWGHVYLSTDNMATKIAVLERGSDDKNFVDIVFAPSDNNIVYLITDGYIVYKSTDAGASFTKLINIRDEVLNTVS